MEENKENKKPKLIRVESKPVDEKILEEKRKRETIISINKK